MVGRKLAEIGGHPLTSPDASRTLAAPPCFLADPEPEPRRVRPPVPAMASEFWLLAKRNLRRTARIPTFMDHRAGAIRAGRPRLEGRSA